MRAIILVGGFGKRLRPLTYTTPKQLLPILDRPMIERKISHLVAQGVDDVVLSMGYRPDTFVETYPDNHCAGARLTYVVETEPLGTAGAIAFAAREANIDETFLAMNGDTLTDLDVTGLVSMHNRCGAEATITLTPVEDPSRFGVVPTHDDGRVIAFIEKPAPGEAPTNLINAGTYVLEPAFVERITPGREMSIEREVFPQVVDEGLLYAGHFDHYWLDIGTPEAYLKGNLDALDVDFAGESYVSNGAVVAESAGVSHSVIGANARIGSGAKIVDSVIMHNAVIGDGVVIEQSIVGENATVGNGAYLSQLSVVGGNLAVDGGASLVAEKVQPIHA